MSYSGEIRDEVFERLGVYVHLWFDLEEMKTTLDTMLEDAAVAFDISNVGGGTDTPSAADKIAFEAFSAEVHRQEAVLESLRSGVVSRVSTALGVDIKYLLDAPMSSPGDILDYLIDLMDDNGDSVQENDVEVSVVAGDVDNSVVEEAVAIYRERYSPVGVYECEVYPGISNLLSDLIRKNLRLFVVTTKAKPYADIVVKHLGLQDCFTDVIGAGLDGRFDDKAEMIQHILSSFGLNARETVMIGDRERDIQAGKANGTRTMGITYGYGSLEEIETARPDWICHSPEEIRTLLNPDI